MKTAVATADSPRVLLRWDIERLEPGFDRPPFWSIKRSQGDMETALGWLEIQRRREPERRWRIKVVTTIVTEEILDA